METFIESANLAFSNQLNNFCRKIDGYANLLDLDTKDVQGLKKFRDLVLFIFDQHERV